MDLRSLNTFITVSELSSFTGAAERLGYSQPTISFQIKQLEDEVGGRLFDRIGHTVKLTDKGKRILVYAQRMCRLRDEMINEELEREIYCGTIRIAMADSLCQSSFSDRFVNFHTEFPNVSLKINTMGTNEMFKMIDKNETDILCTLDTHIYENAYTILSEEKIGVHFVCSTDNKLCDLNEISLERLLQEPLLLTEKGMSYRKALDEYLAKKSMEAEVCLETGNTEVLCRLAEQNVGISFLPDFVTQRLVLKGSLKMLNVTDLEIELWRQVLVHKDKWISPAMRVVIDFLSMNIDGV